MSADEEIKTIFERNKVEDLNRFLSKRACLNTSAQFISYAFYLLQASSIVLTSIGQTYQSPYCIWGGISIASLAGVIHHVQSVNKQISKSLLSNIKLIKLGTYVDEGGLNLDDDSSAKKSITAESGATTPLPVLRSVSSI
jgi:hypothetical protein